MSLEDKMNEWESEKLFAAQESIKPTLNIIDFRDKEKVTIVPISDEHIGSKYYNPEKHLEVLEWVEKTKSPIILLGDELETATRDSVGAGVYEQQEILDDQVSHFLKLYTLLAEQGLILGMHPGNHEMRVYKSSGLNLTKILAKQLGVKYLGWGKLHYVMVGNQRYTLYTTHGASGATMPHTKIKACIKLADLAEAEIYAMGHLHQLSHHVRNYYAVNRKKRTVEEAQKHFLLCGSYLMHWGSYGHMKSYEPMRQGSPKIKLSGVKHQIRISL